MNPTRVTNEREFSNVPCDMVLTDFINCISTEPKAILIHKFDNGTKNTIKLSTAASTNDIVSLAVVCYKYYKFPITNKETAINNNISIIANTVGLQYVIPYNVLIEELRNSTHLFDCIGCNDNKIMSQMKQIGNPTLFSECTSAYLTINTTSIQNSGIKVPLAYQLQKNNRSFYDIATGRY